MKFISGILPICCLVLLCACGAKTPPPPPEDCNELYVILPGNFIIDLEGGSRVWLDPAVQEFALFCTPDAARAAFKRADALPGEWRIYKLEGAFADIAAVRGANEYELARPALVTDWVPD